LNRRTSNFWGKSLLLQTEFRELLKRLAVQPALPGSISTSNGKQATLCGQNDVGKIMGGKIILKTSSNDLTRIILPESFCPSDFAPIILPEFNSGIAEARLSL
jgi:hypothetical protein